MCTLPSVGGTQPPPFSRRHHHCSATDCTLQLQLQLRSRLWLSFWHWSSPVASVVGLKTAGIFLICSNSLCTDRACEYPMGNRPHPHGRHQTEEKWDEGVGQYMAYRTIMEGIQGSSQLLGLWTSTLYSLPLSPWVTPHSFFLT